MATSDPAAPLQRAVADFLAAEARIPEPPEASSETKVLSDYDAVGGEISDADRALGALFATLPEAHPSAGFADRVLHQAGILSGRWVPRDLDWRGRWATAAAFALVLTGAFWSLPTAVQLASEFELATAVAAVGGLLSFCIAAVGDAMVLAGRFFHIGRILWLILTSPQVVLALTACAALTLFMGRWLAQLLAVPRSSFHAAAR